MITFRSRIHAFDTFISTFHVTAELSIIALRVSSTELLAHKHRVFVTKPNICVRAGQSLQYSEQHLRLSSKL